MPAAAAAAPQEEGWTDILVDFFSGELEWYFKYGIIISNFILILMLSYFTSKRRQQQIAKQEKRKSILFVISHPDDEAMFFVPTIKNVREEYDLHLFCATNGKVSIRTMAHPDAD
jgi:hypothetical protein